MATPPMSTMTTHKDLLAGSWVYVTDNPRAADVTVMLTTQPGVPAVPVYFTPDRGAAVWVYVTDDPRYAAHRVYVLNPDTWEDRP